MASTHWRNKMYVAGGINFWLSNNSFEAYDTNQGTWEKLPNLPNKLNHMGLAAHEGKIYMSGGFFNARQTKFSNILYVYDIQESKWSVLSDMPDIRAAHTMVVRENYLHLIGGRNHTNIWSYHIKNNKWHTNIISPLPEKRDHISVLQDSSHLYVVGGRQYGETKSDCWKYNFLSNTWEVFTSLPAPRGGQSACIYNQKIHVVGGEDLDVGKTYDRHDIYDPNTEQWFIGHPLATHRHGHVSEKMGDKWYIYGGGKQAGIKTLISTTSNMEVIHLE